MATLQGTNISHLGKRKIIFKNALVRDMLVPRRVGGFRPLDKNQSKYVKG